MDKIKQTSKSNLQELNKTQIKIPVNYGAIKKMLTLTAFTETNIMQHVGYLYLKPNQNRLCDRCCRCCAASPTIAIITLTMCRLRSTTCPAGMM